MLLQNPQCNHLLSGKIRMKRSKGRRPSLLAAGLTALMLGAPASAQDFTSFQSPSGNIGCFIIEGEETYARCDIRDYTPSVMNDQGLCEMEYGDAYAITSGGGLGEVVCHGDTAFDRNAWVLDYGQEVSIGGITCWSEKTGMVCANNRGAGFSVAKRRQEIF